MQRGVVIDFGFEGFFFSFPQNKWGKIVFIFLCLFSGIEKKTSKYSGFSFVHLINNYRGRTCSAVRHHLHFSSCFRLFTFARICYFPEWVLKASPLNLSLFYCYRLHISMKCMTVNTKHVLDFQPIKDKHTQLRHVSLF